MTEKCNICNKNEAVFEVKDTRTNLKILLCSFCPEEPYYEVIGKFEQKKKPLEMLESVEGELGRLHYIGNPRTERSCRVCKKTCEKKIPRYTQSVGAIPFPTQSVVCLKCGEKGVEDDGWEVAPMKVKKVKEIKNE